MIHVIGNAAVDSVIRVDRFPRPGETIVALGASEDLGGKGANQAVAAARCGALVRLVAPIGDDAMGERIRSSLAREGVQMDGVTASPYGTDRCVITVDRHGENTILSLIEAARHFDPIAETRIESWITPGDLVVMQGNLRPSVTRDCLTLARSKGATTILNPSPTYAVQDYDWTLVDLVLVNCGEANELAGGEGEEAARELCKRGAAAVVLTLGAEGGASGRRHRHGRGRRRVLRGLGRRQRPRAGLERSARRRHRSRFDFGHAKGRSCFLSVPRGDGGYT
jgi:ribokinase